MELALDDGALAEEAAGDAVASGELVGQREPDGDREAAADDRVAAVEAALRVEEVHRAAPPAAAARRLAVHLGHERGRRQAARERVAVVAVGGDERVVRPERRHGPGRDRLLADVEVEEAADLAQAVQLGRLLLEAPDEEHLAKEREPLLAVEPGEGRRRSAHALSSSVETSPSGRPSSRALSRRRMILPLRVRGTVGTNEISFGATTAPSRTRAWASSSRSSSGDASKPRLQRDEGLDDLAGHRVGLADHAGLGDRRVLEQRALDLERPDQVPHALDDVVLAPDEPEVAVLVAAGEVSAQVPAAGEGLAVALVSRRGSPGTSTASRAGGRSRPRLPAPRRARLLRLRCAGRERPQRRVRVAPSSRAGCRRRRSWRS